jgi:hypothetical protein
LTYGYNDDQWWSIINTPKERLLVSSFLLKKKNEAIITRVVEHLTNDMDIRALPKGLPNSMTTSLLEIGTKTDNIFLRQQIFEEFAH